MICTICTGTGKTVTGAHIAYALAIKLKEDRGVHSYVQRTKDGKEKKLNPCVMYCGPSQQSVSVVLGKCLMTGLVLCVRVLLIVEYFWLCR